ncbi:MAG: glycosyltransferase family 39 protein [Acidobacteria bacterium]|nr:glycosyltransferase family 39 protein [Acidobacteriota bacterium]
MIVASRGRLLLALAVVVLMRLPFLNQAVQGDDVYYLAIARNALIDPLHPMQMGYTFQGARVTMAGHPHPPLNAYILALLLRIFGDVREWRFHLAYVLFSLIAVAAMYQLAKRFTERPLLATLLFVSVPAFVVNGNSLEADLPFLAFWMAGFAFYFDGRQRLAAASLGLAALGAYQAIFATPILAHHAWYGRRRSKAAWLAVFAAPATLAAWQLSQLLSAGAAPAGVLGGYLKSYGLLALVKKAHSALALTSHLGWIVFPVPAFSSALPAAVVAAFLPGYLWWQRALLAVSLAAGLAMLIRWATALWKERASEDRFLATWGLIFFAGAVAVFFAGSARYLLPLAAPVVFTVLRRTKSPWLWWPALAFSLGLSLTLAVANYQYVNQYRSFVARVAPLAGDRRLWSNAEWGLRYYLERAGGEPLEKDQPVYRGALLVSSELAGKIPYSTGGGRQREVLRADLTGGPVRLIGLGTRSGYSSSDLGVLPFDPGRGLLVLPFDPGRGLLDRVKAEIVDLAEPRLSYLRMSDPEAAPQLLSGFYQIENNAWRWMAEQAAVTLQAPDSATRFEMVFVIPTMAPARRLTIALDGVVLATPAYPAPGRYTLSAPVQLPAASAHQLTLTVDESFHPKGDERRLGLIVQELGLR